MKTSNPGFQFWLILGLIIVSGCSVQDGGSAEGSGSLGNRDAPTSEQSTAVDTPANSEGFRCGMGDVHPMGKSIADTYQVHYQQVEEWFCSGYSFENIMIALETAEALEEDPDQLLLMLLYMDWEEIWIETGFVENE